MKVYIGPYETLWTSRVFSNYMDKKYNYDWNKPNTTFEKILDKVEDGLNWLYNNTANRIFSLRKRKIKVRIDSYDTWGMDNTLAHIILPMLKQLKASKNGTPYIEPQDVPEHLRLTEREDKVLKDGYWNTELNASQEELDATSDKFHSQWIWILDQMIWSFEQELDTDNSHKNYYDPYEPGEVIEDDENSIFDKEWKMKTGKYNPDKHKIYEERKQLGFTLFGKYYQALWD